MEIVVYFFVQAKTEMQALGSDFPDQFCLKLFSAVLQRQEWDFFAGSVCKDELAFLDLYSVIDFLAECFQLTFSLK